MYGNVFSRSFTGYDLNLILHLHGQQQRQSQSLPTRHREFGLDRPDRAAGAPREKVRLRVARPRASNLERLHGLFCSPSQRGPPGGWSLGIDRVETERGKLLPNGKLTAVGGNRQDNLASSGRAPREL